MHKKVKTKNQRGEKEKIKDEENVAAVQLNYLQYLHYIKQIFMNNSSFHGCYAWLLLVT